MSEIGDFLPFTRASLRTRTVSWTSTVHTRHLLHCPKTTPEYLESSKVFFLLHEGILVERSKIWLLVSSWNISYTVKIRQWTFGKALKAGFLHSSKWCPIKSKKEAKLWNGLPVLNVWLHFRSLLNATRHYLKENIHFWHCYWRNILMLLC